MFGGAGFMVGGALACSVGRRGLLVRVARDEQQSLVRRAGVEPMVMGGRASRGWVHVAPSTLEDDDLLAEWVHRGVAAARAAAG